MLGRIPEKLKIIAFLSLGLVFSNSVEGNQVMEGDTAEVSASFLQVNPSVRQAALGGSQSAAHGQFTDSFSNPASLANLSYPELWLGHNKSFIDTKYNSLGFGMPLGRHAVSVFAQHIDEGTAERLDIDLIRTAHTGLGIFGSPQPGRRPPTLIVFPTRFRWVSRPKGGPRITTFHLRMVGRPMRVSRFKRPSHHFVLVYPS